MKNYPRTCLSCGTGFEGGPQAQYCPECRRRRMVQAVTEYQHRKGEGRSRTMGAQYPCDNCGSLYTYKGGRQTLCKACAAERTRTKIRTYLRERYTPVSHQQTCVVCGTVFETNTTTVTCSPACAAEHQREKAREKYLRRKGRQTTPPKTGKTGRPKLSLTPEGVEARHQRQLDKARERYRNRTEEQIAAQAERMRAYQKANKDRIREYNHNYYLTHRGKKRKDELK